MHSLSLLTQSRDDLVLLGKKLADFCLNHGTQTGKPWTFLFNGLPDSGKSLVALGADSLLRPDYYPDGTVGRGVSADLWLIPGEVNPDSIPVSYKNFLYRECFNQHSFDTEISRLQRASPGSVVCIAANILRTPTGVFNYAALGNMGSRYLHAEFEFVATNVSSETRIDIAVQNERLYEGLKQIGLTFPIS